MDDCYEGPEGRGRCYLISIEVSDLQGWKVLEICFRMM